jgi:hypothetical protein
MHSCYHSTNWIVCFMPLVFASDHRDIHSTSSNAVLLSCSNELVSFLPVLRIIGRCRNMCWRAIIFFLRISIASRYKLQYGCERRTSGPSEHEMLAPTLRFLYWNFFLWALGSVGLWSFSLHNKSPSHSSRLPSVLCSGIASLGKLCLIL